MTFKHSVKENKKKKINTWQKKGCKPQTTTQMKILHSLSN